MIRVKLSDPFTSWPVSRQTPGSRGVWGDFEFIINREVKECDLWVVYEGLNDEESAFCPPQNTILITGEPPEIKKYHPSFLAQFATVITCQTDINHPNIILSQQSQPWHAGVVRNPGGNIVKLDYDYFQTLREIHKTRLLSVICSSKSMTKGHKQRLRFVKKLETHFGKDIDVFGTGFNSIPDKWDAIYPYKYHIVLENSSIANYWTEKLSDTFLARSYPIYYGCKNLSSYFPTFSFTPIDINEPDQAIPIIEEIIEDRTYERSMKYIMESNSLVLDKYNLFPMIAQVCSEMKLTSSSFETVDIRPESTFIGKFSKIVNAAFDCSKRVLAFK
ncbi:Uncharacterised protein [uncultured archaeon]|nr:Uncharacterised protein [uncultured archaeon]